MSVQLETITYDKKNPFLANLSLRKNLNLPGSQKNTQHIEVDITGSGLTYECGDSLGIYINNDPEDVSTLLNLLKLSGQELIILPKATSETTLQEALLTALSIKEPTLKSLNFLKDKVTNSADKEKIDLLLDPENLENTKAYLSEIEWIDLLEQFPSAQIQAQEFVDNLKKLVPRLYSIASSPTLYPNTIHLTVGVVQYQSQGKIRKGVASNFLAERANLTQTPIPCFVTKSHFKLPESNETDIIMVGPGTGIAPFRSFIQERVAHNAAGRSWLFFGDQHESTDFLYKEELESYYQQEHLTHLDLAFSRDQKEKIYVQDRMKEKAKELWKWIENGAYIYVCGDAKRMAPDVDAMLHFICSTEGNMDEEEAATFIKTLKKAKRYQRDIY